MSNKLTLLLDCPMLGKSHTVYEPIERLPNVISEAEQLANLTGEVWLVWHFDRLVARVTNDKTYVEYPYA